MVLPDVMKRAVDAALEQGKEAFASIHVSVTFGVLIDVVLYPLVATLERPANRPVGRQIIAGQMAAATGPAATQSKYLGEFESWDAAVITSGKSKACYAAMPKHMVGPSTPPTTWPA